MDARPVDRRAISLKAVCDKRIDVWISADTPQPAQAGVSAGVAQWIVMTG
jgi:hypothetical protein